MPNELHYEIRCSTESLQYLLDQGADSIIVSGVLRINGKHTLELSGYKSAVKLPPPTGPGTCPMPCSFQSQEESLSE
jgi:hypothetical protein